MKKQICRHVCFIAAVLGTGLTFPGFAKTFVVTNTNDSGAGSLRQAITDANSRVGADTVAFNIPESDPGYNVYFGFWTIQPVSGPLVITDDSTLVDGTTQALNRGVNNPWGPEIEISGNNTVMEGINIEGTAYNKIYRLAINRFVNSGISIIGIGSNRNIVCGNYIGTDPLGSTGYSNTPTGILIRNGKHNTIGGTSPEMRNIISGNRTGISIASDSNRVMGNYIGTDRSGTTGIGNNMRGIAVTGAFNVIGGSNAGERNIISANSYGVNISGMRARKNIVAGNIIGLDASGSIVLKNGRGIEIYFGATENLVGGPEHEASNVISGSNESGILLESTSGNSVLGNLIGTDATGTFALGNHTGISIRSDAKGNFIGGPDEGEGNCISGNTDIGIQILRASADSNAIRGNFIGTDITGTVSVPNGNGVVLADGAGFNTIGGISEGDGNLIAGNSGFGIWVTSGSEKNLFYGNRIGCDMDGEKAIPNHDGGIGIDAGAKYNVIGPWNIIRFNGGYGILVSSDTTNGNTITRNSISRNQGGGIFLEENANSRIEAPVITGSSPFQGTAPANCIVEIFSDSSYQGRTYEGSVNSDASGNWTWTGTVHGPYITATATDGTGNTSEFSTPVAVITGIKQSDENVLPLVFDLKQNFPNPFNPMTTIRFSVKKPCRVMLKVFDIRGEEVAVLINAICETGIHDVQFDASGLVSGIYFYRIQMGNFQYVQKMVMME